MRDRKSGGHSQRKTNSYEPLVYGKLDRPSTTATASSWPLRAFSAAILLSAILPLIALFLWASKIAQTPGALGTFAGAQIGGMLSQSQAKALDVACGALLGPLLMAALNYIWFSSARVSAVNERTRNNKERGVPLTSLVAVSSTSSGSFDLFNLYDLVRGRTWRLCFFAALTMLSAVARASLCNLIVYEAYLEDRDSTDVAVLRALSDNVVSQASAFTAMDPIATYKYTPDQQADISGQISTLLTGLYFRDASSHLDYSGAYVGVNATTGSMNSLPQSVVRLVDLPAYRLTVKCEPAVPSSLTVVQFGSLSTHITALWSVGEDIQLAPSSSESAGKGGTLLVAEYPGVPASIQSAYNEYYAFVGFAPNKSEAVLAYMTSFNLTQSKYIISSRYGDVHPSAFNMTSSGFRTKLIMTAWGVRCALYRQDGYANYSRSGSRDNQSQSWEVAATRFQGEKRRVPSFLGDWQLEYSAPGAVIPGLGPPLAATAGVPCEGLSCSSVRPLDFGTYAQNFLYASAAAEQIVYNVAAADPARDLPEYFYNASGGVEEVFYRITYVPLILLVGLLSLAGAATITGIMLIYTSSTLSTRSFRQVDVLRLVFDGVLGLWGDIPAMAKMKEQDNDALQEWAKQYFVSYTEEEEGGRRVVRLSNLDRTSG
ncbi:hypothetical protein SLS62_003523 [Diatrype stigma]|uniref:Uncharacterized protein n=1 Tax=Diatrype stigma TaxID=117547 RepID=A0AAN9YPV7_9PEZI